MVWVYLLIIGCVQARSAEVCFGHFNQMIARSARQMTVNSASTVLMRSVVAWRRTLRAEVAQELQKK